jgi:hypothetical protein
LNLEGLRYTEHELFDYIRFSRTVRKKCHVCHPLHCQERMEVTVSKFPYDLDRRKKGMRCSVLDELITICRFEDFQWPESQMEIHFHDNRHTRTRVS